MTGYTKLFGSIVASTVWREPHTVRIVWITMLAMAGKNGVVEASLPGLADMARVTMDECKAAIAALSAPDEFSRTEDHEGRRIGKVEGGWAILNHAKYRAKMGAEERREYLRMKQQEHRTKVKEKAAKAKPTEKPSTRRQQSQHASTLSTHAEAEAEAEAELTPAELNLREHVPNEPKATGKPAASPSEAGLKFADWFKTLLPADMKHSGRWRENWATVYDDMLRLDSRTREQVFAVCTWARGDGFWSRNFMSPMKLREKKNGVQYFDTFTASMKSTGRNGHTLPEANNHRKYESESL